MKIFTFVKLLGLIMLFNYSMVYANPNLMLNAAKNQHTVQPAPYIFNNIYSATSPTLYWTVQVGASGGISQIDSVSADTDGSVYVAGYTQVGLSGQPQNAFQDYFIAKYDQGGNLAWSRQVGNGSGNAYANAVSADGLGNVYVTGVTNVGLSGETQNGNEDCFMARYDKLGNLIWARQFGSTGGYTQGRGIVADNKGYIYVVGETTVGVSGQTQHGDRDYFIAKYDQFNTLAWAKQVGVAGGTTAGKSIDVDASGNSYIVGYTTKSISSISQKGIWDYFVAKYTSTGVMSWTKQVGTTGGTTWASGVAVDSTGASVAISGNTNVAISSQPFSGGQNDGFVAKYTSGGALSWTKVFGNAGDTPTNAVSTDIFNNIYIVGQTNVGLYGQTQTGTYDYYINKYNYSNGNLIWSRQVGAAGGWSDALGVSAAMSGNIYLGGGTFVGLSGQSQTGVRDYFLASWW